MCFDENPTSNIKQHVGDCISWTTLLEHKINVTCPTKTMLECLEALYRYCLQEWILCESQSEKLQE